MYSVQPKIVLLRSSKVQTVLQRLRHAHPPPLHTHTAQWPPCQRATMSAPSPAHRDVLAITGNITNTHTASMAMVVKPAAAAAAALYFMLRILRDRYPHLWSCIEPLLTPVLVAVCKGDRHPPSGPQAVCPTPGCHRVFRPRFPELRWDALHMHLKTCCPVLRGAICSTRRPRQELPGCAEAPADEGAPQRAALCRLRMWGALPAATSRAVSRYACPVVGCDLRFRHRWQCYHHFVATTNTSSTKGKDAHRQHWSQALLMCTARGSGHLSPAGQKGARREAARPTAAAVAKQLYSAAKSGNLGTVATILAASPKLNPNTGGTATSPRVFWTMVPRFLSVLHPHVPCNAVYAVPVC